MITVIGLFRLSNYFYQLSNPQLSRTGKRVFPGQGLLVGEQQRLVCGVERGRSEGGRRGVDSDRLRVEKMEQHNHGG